MSNSQIFEKRHRFEIPQWQQFWISVEPIFNLKFPRYGCPQCQFNSDKFNEVTRHMDSNRHYYEGYGTYPMLIENPTYMVAMGYYSLPECHECREKIIKARFHSCWPGFQIAYSFCSQCINLLMVLEK
jgi:hypothetical protein